MSSLPPARSPYCRHAGPSRIVRTQTANGHWQVRRQCVGCNEMFGSAMPHAPGWEKLPIVAAVYQNPPCEVCGEQPTTNHHWLPRHIANLAELAAAREQLDVALAFVPGHGRDE